MKITKPDVELFDIKKKKPIAYCTKATSDLLVVLKQECSSWEELLQRIHYDSDAKRIVQIYITKKIPFDEVKWR